MDDDTRINSLAFHRRDDLLVSASNDDIIRIYDTYRGQEINALQSKKYGVANICYTHDPQSVIYSSTKGTHAWRYHDLHSNRYVRYFSGHSGRVTGLHMSPKTDQVLSAAEDKNVLMWDLKNGQCISYLVAPGLPTVAWDEQGIVFCVAAECGVVKLYDARNFSCGPFASFVVQDEKDSNALFALVKFSLDGKRLLAVVESRIYVLDSFNGHVFCKISTGVPDGGQALEATLTPDGEYIISGCADRHIRVWRVSTGEEIAIWPQHASLPTCLKFSPKKLCIASACHSVSLWIPKLE